MKENFLIFFGILLLVCSMLASFSSSPVGSVLFLIMCFYLATCVLFIYNAEFLALAYVVVYVGAVAVLFLFTIMMLDIRIKKNFFSDYRFFIFLFLSGVIQSSFILFATYSNDFFAITASSVISPVFLVDTYSNLEVFGQVLYNYHVFNFLIGGLILLIALVGCIVITVDHSGNR